MFSRIELPTPVDQKLTLYAYICDKTSFWSPDPDIQGPTLNFKYTCQSLDDGKWGP